MRRGDGQNRHFCGAFREKKDRSGALKLDESFIARVTKERDDRNACQFLLPLQRHENKNQQVMLNKLQIKNHIRFKLVQKHNNIITYTNI